MSFRLTLSVEGLPRDEGQVRLSVFLSELQLFTAALKKFDIITSGGRPTNYFRVTGLAYSSPATVSVEAYPEDISHDTTDALAKNVVNTFVSIEKGLISDDIPYDILNDLKRMAAPIGKKLRSVSLISDSRRFEISRNFVQNIDDLLSKTETCEGSIEGSLEQINIHAGANMFSVYPRVGPTKIRCYFRQGLLETATSAIGREVLVTGLLHYMPNAPYPYAVDVEDIEIYPPESELPTWDDLKGLAPRATEEKSSEDFLAELRDAWIERVYWDSCLFLAWLKDEKNRKPGEMAGVREYVGRIKRREVQMMTSTLTYAEVLEANLPVGVYELFDDLMKRTSISRISVDMRIARLARELREHYVRAKSQYNNKTLAVPDAIHLATAVLYKADEFHTFDENDRKERWG